MPTVKWGITGVRLRHYFDSIVIMKSFKRAGFVIALSFSLIFVAGAVAQAGNPIMDFVGGESGIFVQPESKDTYEQHYAVQGRRPNNNKGFINFMVNLFGFGSRSKSTASHRADYKDWDDTPVSSVSGENVGPTPILNCLPGVVEKDEPALIFWQCLDSSQTASAVGFSTGGSALGHVRVNAASSTVYTLNCSAGSTAKCSVDSVAPSAALSVSDNSVKLWEKVLLSWSTVDMQSCEIGSDDDNSKYKDWSRNGVESVDGVQSHPITKETTFTLKCTTDTGLERTKSVIVSVD